MIDFFVLKRINTANINDESSNDLTPDHKPVILMSIDNFTKQSVPQNLTNNRANLKKFRRKLLAFINLASHLENESQIYLEVEPFIAANESTPENNKNKMFLNHVIQEKYLR